MAVSDLSVPGRTLVMGIVNVTEDSFSDGGRWIDVRLHTYRSRPGPGGFAADVDHVSAHRRKKNLR